MTVPCFTIVLRKAYGLGQSAMAGGNYRAPFMIDDVIDPAETRASIVNMLAAIRPAPPRAGKNRPMIDAW